MTSKSEPKTEPKTEPKAETEIEIDVTQEILDIKETLKHVLTLLNESKVDKADDPTVDKCPCPADKCPCPDKSPDGPVCPASFVVTSAKSICPYSENGSGKCPYLLNMYNSNNENDDYNLMTVIFFMFVLYMFLYKLFMI
jgi:hypothetical protein